MQILKETDNLKRYLFSNNIVKKTFLWYNEAEKGSET